jgi:hypothetical protein
MRRRTEPTEFEVAAGRLAEAWSTFVLTLGRSLYLDKVLDFLLDLGAAWRLMLVDAIRREPHKRAQRRGWKRG